MQSQVDLQKAESFCNSGNELKSQGKLNEAIAIYQKALEIRPDYSEVHHNLAEIYLMHRRLAEAGASCKLALKLQPDFAAAYKTLGNILQAQGKIAEALRAYSKALDINPNFAEALVNKGTMLSKQGQPEEAIGCYQKAIELKPDLAAAYWNLGNILMKQERPEEAVPCWQKAIELKPELLSAETLNDLGTALGKQGKFEEAIKSYQKAIELKPDYGLAHFNLGNLLKQKGQIEEAVVYLYKAIQLNPNYMEAYNQLGTALLEQNKLDEAVTQYQKLLKIMPEPAKVHLNLGTVLAKQKKFQEAIVQFEKAIEIKPDFTEAYCNIAMAIQQEIQQQSELDIAAFNYAIKCLKKAIKIQPNQLFPHFCMAVLICTSTINDKFYILREAADKYLEYCGEVGYIMAAISYIKAYIRSGMTDLAKQKLLAIEPKIYQRIEEFSTEEIAVIYSQILYNLYYVRDDLDANSKLAKLIGEKYVNKVINYKNNKIEISPPKARIKEELRIGFLSSYFMRHSVGWCSYEIIRELSNLTPNVYLYSTSDRQPDDRTKLFEKTCQKFYKPKNFPNGIPDAKEIIDEILQDELDILIDLDSLTVPVQVEIIHQKPAPVCLTWLGFEAPFIDERNYFLGDWHTHPSGREKYNREQLIRMPDSFVAVNGFECKTMQREVNRKRMRIAEEQVVFLCVAPAYKLNSELIKAQIKILQQVPDSVLIYKGHTGDTEVIKAAYQKECQESGVGLHRVKFMPLVKTEEEHRTTYKIADVLLDSYPYNGGTHNLEALWFNLPVVTRTGEQYLSRMGYSFLRSLDISTGIAQSWEEYINWGIQLGKDADLRRSVREKLQQSKQPESLASLWNPKKFAQDMYTKLQELLAEKISSQMTNDQSSTTTSSV